MKKIIETHISIFLILAITLANIIIFSSTQYAKNIGDEWTVVCKYDGMGHLLGYTCTSGGDHYCGCD